MPAHNARFGVRRGDVQAESPVGHFPSERQAAGRYLQAKDSVTESKFKNLKQWNSAKNLKLFQIQICLE